MSATQPASNTGGYPVPDETRCTAKSKQTHQRCKRKAIDGGNVCTYHGGNASQVRQAAAVRVKARKINKEAAAVLAHEGVEPVEDPLTELAKLASSSKALADALGARVNALNKLTEYDRKDSPSIRAEMVLYERALDRVHRMLSDLVRFGFTERQVQIQEREALLVAGIVQRVLSSIGLTAEQQADARVRLAAEFRALDAKAKPVIMGQVAS